MAQEVKIAGATYPDVPSISVPDSNNTYHSFYDTTISSNAASASDIASGKKAWVNGSLIEGTASGSATVSVVDTLDANGGTIRTITAVSLQGDTVTAATLLSGYTAHDAGGNAITGEYVPSGASLQAKTGITPTESSQTITADTGYDGLSSVQINAISSTYVGSGITSRSSTDLSASGATVTVPSGYYASQATKSIASGSVTAPSTISGSSASVTTGTNTLTLSKTVSVTPNVTTAGYVSSGTAGNASVSLSASVTTKAATTYHPSTSDQTIASGTYATGTQTIKAVTLSNLTAGNIKSGVVVKVGDSTDDDCVTSVTGTYEGSGGGGSEKNIQAYLGYATRKANSYGATDVTLTVAKSGTYKVSWCAWRSSSQGTMGTNLYKNSTAGTNQQTFTGTYGQCITLTGQSYAAGDVLTVYATSGSTSRSIYVGNLIIEEQ